jgi:hypothetical protein
MWRCSGVFRFLFAMRMEVGARSLLGLFASLLPLARWKVLESGAEAQRQQAYDRLLAYIRRAKRPKRSKTRIDPRAVWGSRKYYPGRASGSPPRQSK